MTNRLKEYCRDIAQQIRMQVDANNVLRSLSEEDRIDMVTVQTTKKNYQDIDISINDYLYCKIRVSWKKICIIQHSSSLYLRMNRIELNLGNKEYNGQYSKPIELQSVTEVINFIRRYF